MKNNLFIIIQARMNSTRLPGKVLLSLCGKSVLEVMLERLGDLQKHVIIATTNDGTQLPIVTLCESMSIRYFEGDTEHVLSRYYETATSFGAVEDDIIVRLTSDCPLIDHKIVKEIIDYFKKNDYDYVSNTFERTFPRGMDTEVFSFHSLQTAFENANTTFEKEHVTTYIHTTHKYDFNIGSFKDREDNSKYRLTLDEEADYEAIKSVYDQFDCKLDFEYETLIEMLKNCPKIYEINKAIEQKKS